MLALIVGGPVLACTGQVQYPGYPRLGCGFVQGGQTSTLTPTPLYPTRHPMGFTLPLPIPRRDMIKWTVEGKKEKLQCTADKDKAEEG